MEVRSHFKLFFGMLFAAFGLIGIFDLWGFLAISLPWQVWPIGLIVVGVLFMVRQKGLAFIGILLLIVLGIFSSGWDCCAGESRDFSRHVDLNGSEYVDLNLEYGAGSIVLGESGYADEIIFWATTSGEDPVIEERMIESEAKKIIDISRGDGVNLGDNESWKIFLSDSVIYDLDMEYGVADVSLDLRGLKINKLEISQGVSDSRIVFGDYPTVAKIEGGVGDIDFEFAEGSGVVIEVEGGLLDKDFDGFVKRDGKWYSEGYDEDGENIVVSFEGGIVDLGASFY
ncbi:hypothetical protein HN903_02180 [archaeon]|jgi:hypothetical protein|nr:hypothetical protein [archaeon]MBT7128540.1 hypothetical protein [archaeon]